MPGNDPSQDATRLLWKAAQTGDRRMASRALAAGANIDFQAPDRRTPLMLCIQRDHVGLAMDLMQAGADTSLRTIDDRGPVHVALDRGNLRLAEMLLAHGGERHIFIDAGKYNAWEFAFKSMQDGNEAIIASLFRGEISRCTGLGLSDPACGHGVASMLELSRMIAAVHGFSSSDTLHFSKRTQLLRALPEGIHTLRVGLAGTSITAGGSAFVSVPNFTVIESSRIPAQSVAWIDSDIRHLARIQVGDVAYGEIRETRTFDDNNYQSGSVIDFYWSEHPETIARFIKSRPSLQSGADLVGAIYENDIDRIRDLLSKGVDPALAGVLDKPALHVACSLAKVDVVKALLRHKACVATVGLPDAMGDTPLHYAVSPYARIGQDHQVVKIIDALLANGAQIDALSRNGATPLIYAASCGETDSVEHLIKRGANIAATDESGNGVIHHLIRSKLQFVARAVELGADINAVNKVGNSPLHAAVDEVFCSAEDILELLRCGADVSLRNGEGKLAAELNDVNPEACAAIRSKAALNIVDQVMREAGLTPPNQSKPFNGVAR
jgi:ankyrin repeat protein